MTSEFGCDREEEVVRAFAVGELSGQLAEHCESCDNCREVIHVSWVLKKNAGETKSQVPAAGFVWWQSRLRHKQSTEQRLAKVMSLARAATVTVSALGLVAWAIVHRSDIGVGLREVGSSVAQWSSPNTASSVLALAYITMLLLVINIVLTVRAHVSNRRGMKIEDGR